jgi:hypothetical protein
MDIDFYFAWSWGYFLRSLVRIANKKGGHMARSIVLKNRPVALVAIALSLLLMVPHTALSQTAITPIGEGTPESPYQISEISHLVWMSETAADSAGKYYTMTADIDASATATWNDAGTDTSILEGFKPIGTYVYPDKSTVFQGIFDGGGHTITGLIINRRNSDCVGLFGYIGSDGEVRNLGLVGGSVKGCCDVGGLAGTNCGTVSNTYATITMGPGGYLGGLIGSNSGTVSNSHATGAVTGDASEIGGLIGSNSGAVSNCYATGSVTGHYAVGGLIGDNNYGTVTKSFATGMAIGRTDAFSANIGGLIGSNSYSTVSDVYASGTVIDQDSTIGGLIGYNDNSTVTNAYSTGRVIGSLAKGLIGYNRSGTISNSYWDIETSKIATSNGGTGLTTAQMMQITTFADWDFSNIWIINENVTYPRLRSLLIPGDANGDGRVDVSDLGILAGNYGEANKTWFRGDFNNDGAVDVGDLGILAAHYGQGTASAAMDFDADCAKAFGETVDDTPADDEVSETGSPVCSSLGLPLVVGLMLMGLMLVKLDE